MAAKGSYAKGIAKRQEILDVALEVFATYGYDRTSVREIARRTGLSQAGLLHHFATKQDLFLEVLRSRDEREGGYVDEGHVHAVERLVSAVQQNADEPGLVRLFVSMSVESIRGEGDAHAFFVDRYRWLLDQVAIDIRRHQQSGEISSAVDPADAASLLVAAADGLQLQWLLDAESVDMAQRLRALWDMLRRVE